MVIHNSLFDHYRKEAAKVEDAIKLLESQGYMVINKDDVPEWKLNYTVT